MSESRLSRYRAERLLRKDFAGLRSKVLAIVRSQLRAKGVRLDPSDLEACYAQAWQGLYATVLEGETVETPSAWLVLVTFRRAIDEARSAGRIKAAVEAGAAGALERHVGASDPDFAAELDDRKRLLQVFAGLRASLSERECEAASLCYLQGLSRAQAAVRMGVSEARMRKLMEGAGPGRPGVASKVGGLLDTIKAGGWCEQQSSLMRAFAFGVLDPEGQRHALALAHCRECPACRAYVASLRGLASVLPAPLLSPLALAGAGAAGGRSDATAPAGSAGASSGTRARASAKLRAGISTKLNKVGLGAMPGRGSQGGGLGGSLTAKLAVIALMLIGGGYAVLGGRAHGSLPSSTARSSAQPGLASEAPAGEALSQAILPTFARRSRSARSTAGAASAQLRSRRTTRSARSPSNGEFSPERVRRERPAASPAATPMSARPRSGSPRALGEFGIE